MISFPYEYKLKPTKKQIEDIEMYLSICRLVDNSNHGERKDYIQSRKSPINRCSIEKECVIPANRPFPNYNIQANNPTQAKKQYPHLKQVHSQVLQYTLKRLDQAWNDFFQVKGRRFPKFKNCNRFRSFVYLQIVDRDVAAAKVIEKHGNAVLWFSSHSRVSPMSDCRKTRGRVADCLTANSGETSSPCDDIIPLDGTSLAMGTRTRTK